MTRKRRIDDALDLLVERGGTASPNARLAVEAALDVVERSMQASLFDGAEVVGLVRS